MGADESAVGAINRPLREPEREVAGVDKRKISRRAALLTLGMAGVAAVGGITAWQLVSHQPRQTGGSPPTPTTTIAVAETLFTYTGHTLDVYGVAWSPSGLLIASVGQDTTAQVWDASSGATKLIYRGHPDSVQGVDWARDGRSIATCSSNAQVWDATTEKRILNYNQPPLIHGLAWSPDSTRVASVGVDTTVRVWQISTSH